MFSDFLMVAGLYIAVVIISAFVFTRVITKTFQGYNLNSKKFIIIWLVNVFIGVLVDSDFFQKMKTYWWQWVFISFGFIIHLLVFDYKKFSLGRNTISKNIISALVLISIPLVFWGLFKIAFWDLETLIGLINKSKRSIFGFIIN